MEVAVVGGAEVAVLVAKGAVELGQLAELSLLVVVVVVLARGDYVHDLALAPLNAIVGVHTLRCDDDMELLIVLRLGWAPRAAVLDAAFSTYGDLAVVILL